MVPSAFAVRVSSAPASGAEFSNDDAGSNEEGGAAVSRVAADDREGGRYAMLDPSSTDRTHSLLMSSYY